MHTFRKLLLLLILLPGLLPAQQAFTIYNSTNSLLPENSVRCIAVAPDGKKWVGTDYGLASFDGVNWEVFYTNNSGLPDNAIRSIAVDSAGVIWIGTFAAGLVRYDGSTWTNYNTFNSDIPDDYVRTLLIDSLGNKWVGTIGGLAYFDGLSWEIYNTSNSNLGSNNISAMHLDTTSGVLSIGTVNGGINFVDGPNWTHLTNGNSNLPDNTVLGFAKDTSGVLWLSTPASGISAYIGGFLFLTQNTVSSGIQSNSLRAVTFDRNKDQFWIASIDSGVIRKSGNTFTSFNTFNSPMPDNFSQSLAIDHDGIIWIGTQTGGLVRLDESLLTSVESISVGKNFRLFPVPARDHITVENVGNKIFAVEIFDSMGRVKYRDDQVASERTVIDLSGFQNGTYFIRLVSENGTVSNQIFLIQ